MSLSVCFYVCSLTPPKRQTQRAEILRYDSPWDAETSGFVEPLAGKYKNLPDVTSNY